MSYSLPRGARRPHRQLRKSKVQPGAHLGQNPGHRNGLLGSALVGERRMHDCPKSSQLTLNQECVKPATNFTCQRAMPSPLAGVGTTAGDV